jgi:hypothetical protein
MTQFMGFAMNAHNNLFNRAITQQTIARGQDMEMWYAFMGSMMIAGMAYSVQSAVNSVGRPEVLEEKLSMDNIVKASFARAGYTALAPMMWDAAQNTIWGTTMFNKRTTGLPSGSIAGIPAVAIADSIAKVLKASLNAVTNDNRQINRDAGRAAMNLIPVASSMIGIRGITSYVASQLPHNAVIDQELER